LFVAGSASGVTVIAVGDTVLSTVLTAAFHVPKTSLGLFGTPPNCQSPSRGFDVSVVVSVTNSTGHIGRPQSGSPLQVFVSVPDWSDGASQVLAGQSRLLKHGFPPLTQVPMMLDPVKGLGTWLGLLDPISDTE
jgi:hypothetical protein